MSTQQSFALLCILSVLTAFAAEMSQFTHEQRQTLSRINNDLAFVFGLVSVHEFKEDIPSSYHYLALMAHKKIKEAAEKGLVGDIEEFNFDEEYPVVMDNGAGCVRVRVKLNESAICFVTYFYFNEKLSLFIQNDQGTIAFAGMLGSELDEEKSAFSALVFQFSRHEKYSEVIKRITKIIGDKKSKSLVEAMILTSAGLEHEEIEAKRIGNCIQIGSGGSGDNSWCIRITNRQRNVVLNVRLAKRCVF